MSWEIIGGWRNGEKGDGRVLGNLVVLVRGENIHSLLKRMLCEGRSSLLSCSLLLLQHLGQLRGGPDTKELNTNLSPIGLV